jgi:hypothetical protein
LKKFEKTLDKLIKICYNIRAIRVGELKTPHPPPLKKNKKSFEKVAKIA